jgi:diguanylate cyclase (GGDEF)-like protein
MKGSTLLWVGRRTPDSDTLRLLGAAGFKVQIAPSVSEALPVLKSEPPALVILAAGEDTPDLAGDVKHVLTTAPGCLLVALVTADEDIAAALSAGAHDALPFDDGDALPLRVMIWTRTAARGREQTMVMKELAQRVRTLEDRLADTQRENDQLKDLAHRDELTGLGNRRSFRAHLDQAIEFSRRYGGPISILVCDLDGMKRLNDECGHPAGDGALRRIAEIFRASIRGSDHAARLGGDEFAVCMPATSALAAVRVAERMRVRVESMLLPGGFTLSASFGVATLDNPRGMGFAADELFSRADAACYTAKRAGKNRVEVDAMSATSEAGSSNTNMGAA